MASPKSENVTGVGMLQHLKTFRRRLIVIVAERQRKSQTFSAARLNVINFCGTFTQLELTALVGKSYTNTSAD